MAEIVRNIRCKVNLRTRILEVVGIVVGMQRHQLHKVKIVHPGGETGVYQRFQDVYIFKHRVAVV